MGRVGLKRCPECDGTLKMRVLAEYRDDKLLGLPGITVEDGVEEERCTRCRKKGTTFPNLAGLLAASGLARVLIPLKLNGTEIRFLRKQLGWTHPVMAERLGVREETVSRWENDREVMNVPAEKLFRLCIGRRLKKRARLIPFDSESIEEMQIRPVRDAKRQVQIRLRLVRAPRGRWAWEAAEAA